MSLAFSGPVAAIGASVGFIGSVATMSTGLFLEESGKPLTAVSGVGLASSVAGTALSGGSPWLMGASALAAVPAAAFTLLGAMQMWETRKRLA